MSTHMPVLLNSRLGLLPQGGLPAARLSSLTHHLAAIIVVWLIEITTLVECQLAGCVAHHFT